MNSLAFHDTEACEGCGYTIPAGDRFCPECRTGTREPEPPFDPATLIRHKPLEDSGMYRTKPWVCACSKRFREKEHAIQHARARHPNGYTRGHV